MLPHQPPQRLTVAHPRLCEGSGDRHRVGAREDSEVLRILDLVHLFPFRLSLALTNKLRLRLVKPPVLSGDATYDYHYRFAFLSSSTFRLSLGNESYPKKNEGGPQNDLRPAFPEMLD
jgi:hypothetical protein